MSISSIWKNGVEFNKEILALEDAPEGSDDERTYIKYMSETVIGPCAISSVLIRATRCQFWHGQAVAEKYKTGEVRVTDKAFAKPFETSDGEGRNIDTTRPDEQELAPPKL